ncbi:DUF1987 domain-containing protein [Magnetospira thiophila]
MENISLPAGQRTPGIEFDFAANRFLISGESYPENVTEFFGSLIGDFQQHLESQSGADIFFTFRLKYFNSSTAKVLMLILESLDETASRGNKVTVIWCYEADDDNMMEMGEEFGEDLENADFQLQEIDE